MIYKFQDGGASVPPFVSFTPVAVTRPREVAAATSSDAGSGGNSKGKSGDLALKDVLELIEKKIDALPNDASYIIHSAKRFFANQALGVSAFGESSSYNTSAIAMQYLNLLDSLTQAKHFKNEYDEAFKIVRDNGGLNEVAVTTSGHLICRDPETGDFQLMTPQEQREAGYVALTNSQLLDLRALQPENAMNIDLIKTVANGVGTNTISKFIEDRLSNLGHDKLEREGYSRTEANKIVDGLNYLQQAASTVGDAALAVGAPMTIDGIYKYTTLSDTQSKQALAAINYIYTTMPQNMKAVLEAKADAMNLNKDGRGVYNLIFQYVGSKVSNTNSVNISATKNINGADNVGDGSEDKGKLTSAMMFVNGLTAGTQVTLRGIGTHGMQVYGNVIPLMKDENSPLGANESLSKATESTISAVLDWDHVTMGGQRIDPNQFPLVKIDSQSFYRVFLPFDPNDPDKPNFALLDRVAEAHKELKAMGIDAMKPTAETIEKINKVYASKQLPLMFDNRGNLRISAYKAFGAVHGEAIGRAFVHPDDAENSYYLNEINDSNQIEQIIYNLKKSNGDEPNFSEKNLLNSIFGGHDNMYEGMIYVPIRESNLNAMYGTGYKPTAAEANSMYARDAQINRGFSYTSGDDMFAN